MSNEYDAILQRLIDEYEVPESEIEPLKGSTLRAKIAELSATNESLAGEVAGFKKAPLKTEAFKDYDLEALTAAQKYIFENFDWEGEVPAEDTVKELATKFEFPAKAEAAPDEGARGIVAQAGLAAGAHPTNLSTDEQLAEAEAKGDFATASAIKSQKLQALTP